VLDEVIAEFFVEVDDSFGIGLGVEAMVLLRESVEQGLIVVYFAVEDNPDGLVFVVNGLIPAGEVDDA